MPTGTGGISLQINEIETQIVLPQFLVEGIIKAVGNIDNTLNDDRYSFSVLTNPVSVPWRQDNPIKPIQVAESAINISDMLLVYPTDPEDQAAIPKMPHSQKGIVYVGNFVVHGDVSMGGDSTMSTVIDTLTKRFLAIENASIFPMFSTSISMPEVMPIILVNKERVYQLHAAE